MTIKNLTYLIALALLAASCSSDDIGNDNQTLSGDGTKTPLCVTALLDAGGATTRAADKDFASGDELLAYLRHVTWDSTSNGARTPVEADQAPRLVMFSCTGSATWDSSMDDILPFVADKTIPITGNGTKPDTKQAAGLTASATVNALYWDDFSNSATPETDLRTKTPTKHFLQSYYGYCYNGGTPIEGLEAGDNKEKGIIKWAVQPDQAKADKTDFQHSDLLWSAEQTPIEYAHVDGEGHKNHGTLILPYTHAMSKVTIIVTLHESFGDGAVFKNVTTKLHDMFTHCECTAPTYTLSHKGTATEGETTDITMWNGISEKESSEQNSKAKTCTFEAIVVPSILSVVNNFATITGLDGNKYVIPITDKMLQKASTSDDKTGWGDELTETVEHISDGTAQKPAKTRAAGGPIPMGKGFEMKSGVNYVLNVNISKQEITVSATIKDWVDVNANGVGLVQFNADVNGKDKIADELKIGGFDVYKNSINTAFDTKSTTLTWDNTNSEWRYNPAIYWAGQQDASYFRAISPSGALQNMSQGTDRLWGYACDDDPNDGNKVGTKAEVKITPRTGDVPLHFLHPMSKISVKLETSSEDAKKVNLTGAKLSIINLYDQGTLSMVDGTIGSLSNSNSTEAYTFKDQTFDANNKWSDKIVIPQSLINDKDGNARTQDPTFSNTGVLTDRGDKIVMYLTLADGTRYKLNLSDCVVTETGVPVTAWERNKHYTYTILVEKEAITFRALIKNWEDVQGSGNANLEWD